MMPLEQVLELVGDLDDAPGEKTPRERFRRFLSQNLTSVGAVRDYVEECLRSSGEQYNRALQDLVNHLGRLLGFDVTFGRYKGVQGEIGFDGVWKSPSGLYIVVEVKTTDVYAIKTATLLGYIDRLISEQKIPDWDHALGLYVVGRSDAELKQLENSIIAEKRTHQLRVITVDKLLTLAELLADYEMEHEAVLTVLRPTGPIVDSLIELMAGLVVKEIRTAGEGIQQPQEETTNELSSEPEGVDVKYYLTSVASDDTCTAEECIKKLLGAGIFAASENLKRKVKPGDWICFYATATGVVAHARVKSSPVQKHHPLVKHPEKYPYVFEVDSVSIYTENPVVLSAELRAKLDAFQGRDSSKRWAWFVQGTGRVTKHDFMLLTRQAKVEVV
ncbi:EVE domain-containing protein [Acetivibrio thermocellus AD2]|jgi:hypothetical protein|uniref:EVE domain-containing protein n=1 Tax=Acetivibrio thermocellus AD2 TaxID=1138384 RepID=A0AB36TD76_ACETH|nr:EVE domain-containing protein [Acetivibrio thermocellus]ADU73568.1 protein of unknown function DUF55 [Acetivibrio thermocellus DSM 1313]ALX07489.1 putative protein family UPF0310 [Acetivibrio thermocellus AD2]ANV75228.1 putative protein family UPF0310 [Acetivibrio thermocellus DSM 2360]EIC03415.1 hypothetical protein YSBL_2903 [Acetivibrio thermocellus YS]PFH01753.1 EVE domain-containing protein [Acetivibrio thermocellus AD2]